MKRWIANWGPAIAMMIFIFIVSATPGNEIPDFGFGDFAVKKGGHMFVYALLALAYSRALKRNQAASRYRFVIAVSLAVLYALTDEFHQKFTPGRTPSIWDVCFDTAGAIIGLWLWRIFQKRHLNPQEAGMS